LAIVVNASRKDVDYAHIRTRLPSGVGLETYERGLIALQGPKAVDVVSRHMPEVRSMPFMTAVGGRIAGIECSLTRSGYTGEDGFELSVATGETEALARALLAEPEVRPAGLGARDSLRLEAGLPLHGQDLDESTSPIEAAIDFAVARRRREVGDFPGAERILEEIIGGPTRLRVGIRPEGKAPARDGARIVDASGRAIGVITSGSYGPSIGGPIAMGYVETAAASAGTSIHLEVRGKRIGGSVVPLPFVPHRYFRKTPAS
jgi:aminomethyltransferase